MTIVDKALIGFFITILVFVFISLANPAELTIDNGNGVTTKFDADVSITGSTYNIKSSDFDITLPIEQWGKIQDALNYIKAPTGNKVTIVLTLSEEAKEFFISNQGANL